jgi:hypothetical protein
MIEKELHKRYPSGCRVSNKELKKVIQMLYDTYGIKAVATATDITRYGYSTRACKIPSDNGRINGLILIAK